VVGYSKTTKSAQGGAVYTSGEKLTVNNSKFDTCQSSLAGSGNGGGAINTIAEELAITGSDFVNCSSIHQGGAVYHYNAKTETAYAKTMELTDCTFTNCTSRAGGGVEADVINVTVTGCKFDNCKTTGSAPTNGGGINNYYDKPPFNSVPSDSNVTITNTQPTTD